MKEIAIVLLANMIALILAIIAGTGAVIMADWHCEIWEWICVIIDFWFLFGLVFMRSLWAEREIKRLNYKIESAKRCTKLRRELRENNNKGVNNERNI